MYNLQHAFISIAFPQTLWSQMSPYIMSSICRPNKLLGCVNTMLSCHDMTKGVPSLIIDPLMFNSEHTEHSLLKATKIDVQLHTLLHRHVIHQKMMYRPISGNLFCFVLPDKLFAGMLLISKQQRV